MADIPESDAADDIGAADPTGFDFHDLPDGGTFVAPHGWQWLSEVLDVAAMRVWPNGDLSVLSNPGDNATPRWRRYKHGNIDLVPANRSD